MDQSKDVSMILNGIDLVGFGAPSQGSDADMRRDVTAKVSEKVGGTDRTLFAKVSEKAGDKV